MIFTKRKNPKVIHQGVTKIFYLDFLRVVLLGFSTSASCCSCARSAATCASSSALARCSCSSALRLSLVIISSASNQISLPTPPYQQQGKTNTFNSVEQSLIDWPYKASANQQIKGYGPLS